MLEVAMTEFLRDRGASGQAQWDALASNEEQRYQLLKSYLSNPSSLLGQGLNDNEYIPLGYRFTFPSNLKDLITVRRNLDEGLLRGGEEMVSSSSSSSGGSSSSSSSGAYQLTLRDDPSGAAANLVGVGFYDENESANISATAASGYTFDYWTIDRNLGTLENFLASNTTFIMPAADITATAHFVPAGDPVLPRDGCYLYVDVKAYIVAPCGTMEDTAAQIVRQMWNKHADEKNLTYEIYETMDGYKQIPYKYVLALGPYNKPVDISIPRISSAARFVGGNVQDGWFFKYWPENDVVKVVFGLDDASDYDALSTMEQVFVEDVSVGGLIFYFTGLVEGFDASQRDKHHEWGPDPSLDTYTIHLTPPHSRSVALVYNKLRGPFRMRHHVSLSPTDYTYTQCNLAYRTEPCSAKTCPHYGENHIITTLWGAYGAGGNVYFFPDSPGKAWFFKVNDDQVVYDVWKGNMPQDHPFYIWTPSGPMKDSAWSGY